MLVLRTQRENAVCYQGQSMQCAEQQTATCAVMQLPSLHIQHLHHNMNHVHSSEDMWELFGPQLNVFVQQSWQDRININTSQQAWLPLQHMSAPWVFHQRRFISLEV